MTIVRWHCDGLGTHLEVRVLVLEEPVQPPNDEADSMIESLRYPPTRSTSLITPPLRINGDE